VRIPDTHNFFGENKMAPTGSLYPKETDTGSLYPKETHIIYIDICIGDTWIVNGEHFFIRELDGEILLASENSVLVSDDKLKRINYMDLLKGNLICRNNTNKILSICIWHNCLKLFFRRG